MCRNPADTSNSQEQAAQKEPDNGNQSEAMEVFLIQENTYIENEAIHFRWESTSFV